MRDACERDQRFLQAFIKIKKRKIFPKSPSLWMGILLSGFQLALSRINCQIFVDTDNTFQTFSDSHFKFGKVSN